MNMHKYTLHIRIYVYIIHCPDLYMYVNIYIYIYIHSLPSLRFRLFNNTPDEKAKGELKHGRTCSVSFFFAWRCLNNGDVPVMTSHWLRVTENV